MPLKRRPDREIQEIASDLLQKFGLDQMTEFDVDDLALDLGITIETRMGLHAEKGIEGTISQDLKRIYLDNDLFRNEIRWRSTVAHEIGHAVLHANFIQTLPIASEAILKHSWLFLMPTMMC